MNSGSWASYQSALPPEARAGGEPDDDGPAEDVEIITHPCPGCGKPVRAPIDAEGDDLCCSRECVKVVCDRMDAEIERWRQHEIAEMEAALVDGPCSAGCGATVRALPPTHETGCAFCSKECERKRAAELWGSVENPLDDEIPY